MSFICSLYRFQESARPGSGISGPHRPGLKPNIQYFKYFWKARKPLTRKVSQNIQQIPEEKNDNDEGPKSTSDSGRKTPETTQEILEPPEVSKIPEKKKRKKKKVKESAETQEVEKPDLQAEYEEFAKKQKEKETQIKEQKKKVKKSSSKKIEEVKVYFVILHVSTFWWIFQFWRAPRRRRVAG